MLLSYKHAKQMAKNNNLRHGPKQLPNKYPYLYPKTMPSAIRSDSIISWLSHATITLNHYHIELFRNHLLFLPFYAFLVSQNHIFPYSKTTKTTPIDPLPKLEFSKRTSAVELGLPMWHMHLPPTNIWHRRFFSVAATKDWLIPQEKITHNLRIFIRLAWVILTKTCLPRLHKTLLRWNKCNAYLKGLSQGKRKHVSHPLWCNTQKTWFYWSECHIPPLLKYQTNLLMQRCMIYKYT